MGWPSSGFEADFLCYWQPYFVFHNISHSSILGCEVSLCVFLIGYRVLNVADMQTF